MTVFRMPCSFTVVISVISLFVRVNGLFVTPDLKPSAVVQLQLDALQAEDLYTVFKYASPSNKAVTGPWQRFGKMLQSPTYNVLVGHRKSMILMEINGKDSSSRSSVWACRVRIWPRLDDSTDDKLLPQDFIWQLSKVQEEPFVDCWMTDGVFPIQ